MEPDGTPEPDQPSMPPDPFTPADAGYAVVMSEFHGLCRAGASSLEAALITAAHLVVNGLVNPAALPGEQPPGA